LVDGAYDNIKITRPVDLLIAESVLQHRSMLE
jgi:2-C-methyl-D-erythritol 4-phosphate cytidylyltransferase